MNGRKIPPEDSAQYYLDLGIECLTPEGNLRFSVDDAEKYFRKAVDLGSDDAKYDLALLLLSSKWRGSQKHRVEASMILSSLKSVGYDGAEKLFDSLVFGLGTEYDPLSVEELIILGRSFGSIGQIDNAISIFDGILGRLNKDDCGRADILFELSQLYYKKEEYETAFDYATESHDAGSKRASLILGQILANSSDFTSFEVAKDYFEEALSNDVLDAYYELGLLYEKKGDLEKSRSDYEESCSYFREAMMRLKIDDAEEAFYRVKRKIGPDSSAYVNLTPVRSKDEDAEKPYGEDWSNSNAPYNEDQTYNCDEHDKFS